jgi:hypothetical protein
MADVTGNMKINYVFESLEKLAEQIGLHAKELWPYLVKQIYLEAVITSFVVGVITAIALTIICKYGDLRFAKWHEKHSNNTPQYGEYIISDAAKTSTILPLVIIAICGLIFFFFAIPRFYNAEFYAFKDLMEMLGRL